MCVCVCLSLSLSLSDGGGDSIRVPGAIPAVFPAGQWPHRCHATCTAHQRCESAFSIFSYPHTLLAPPFTFIYHTFRNSELVLHVVSRCQTGILSHHPHFILDIPLSLLLLLCPPLTAFFLLMLFSQPH